MVSRAQKRSALLSCKTTPPPVVMSFCTKREHRFVREGVKHAERKSKVQRPHGVVLKSVGSGPLGLERQAGLCFGRHQQAPGRDLSHASVCSFTNCEPGPYRPPPSRGLNEVAPRARQVPGAETC